MEDSITVLFVDEDRDILDLGSTFLERADESLEVMGLSETDEALQIIEEDPNAVDCVISDYSMPGRSGDEFLRAVREHDPELPFFFFTGRDQAQIEAELDGERVDGFVLKGTGTERYAELADDIREAVTDS